MLILCRLCTYQHHYQMGAALRVNQKREELEFWDGCWYMGRNSWKIELFDGQNPQSVEIPYRNSPNVQKFALTPCAIGLNSDSWPSWRSHGVVCRCIVPKRDLLINGGSVHQHLCLFKNKPRPYLSLVHLAHQKQLSLVLTPAVVNSRFLLQLSVTQSITSACIVNLANRFCAYPYQQPAARNQPRHL